MSGTPFHMKNRLTLIFKYFQNKSNYFKALNENEEK